MRVLLDQVRDAVVVAVGIPRMQLEFLLLPVGKAIAVCVLVGICDAVENR